MWCRSGWVYGGRIQVLLICTLLVWYINWTQTSDSPLFSIRRPMVPEDHPMAVRRVSHGRDETGVVEQHVHVLVDRFHCWKG